MRSRPHLADHQSAVAIVLTVVLVLSVPATAVAPHSTTSDGTNETVTNSGVGETAGARATAADADPAAVEPGPTSKTYDLEVRTGQAAVYNTFDQTRVVVVNSNTGERVTGTEFAEIAFSASQGGERIDHFSTLLDDDGDGERDTLVLEHPVRQFGPEITVRGQLPNGEVVRDTRPVVPVSMDVSRTSIPVEENTEVNLTFSDPRGAGLDSVFIRDGGLYVEPTGVDVQVSAGNTTVVAEAGTVTQFPVENWQNRSVTVTATDAVPGEGPGQIDISTTVDPEATTPAAEEHILVDGAGEGFDRLPTSFKQPCTAIVEPNVQNRTWALKAVCTPAVNTDNLAVTVTNEDLNRTVTIPDSNPELPDRLVTETTDNLTFEIVEVNTTFDGPNPDPEPRGSGGTTVGPKPSGGDDDGEPSCTPNAQPRIRYNRPLTISVATEKIASVEVTHTAQSGVGGTKTGAVTKWPEITEPQTARFTVTCEPADPDFDTITTQVESVHWAPFNIKAHLGTIGYDIGDLNFDRYWNLLKPKDTDGTYLEDDTVRLILDGVWDTTELPLSHGYGTTSKVPNKRALSASEATGIGLNEFGDVIYETPDPEPVENIEAPTWMNYFLKWGLVSFGVEEDMAAGSSSIDLAENIDITFLKHKLKDEEGTNAGPVTLYEYEIGWNASYGYKWPANVLTAGTELSAEATVADLFGKGEVSAGIELRPLPFSLQKAQIDGKLIVGKTYGIGTSIPLVGSVEGEAQIGGGLALGIVVGNNWNVKKATIGPAIEAKAEAKGSIWGQEVTGTGTGELTGKLEFDVEPLISLDKLTSSMTVTVTLSTTVWGKQLSASADVFDFDCQYPPASCTSNGIVYDHDPDDPATLRTLGGTSPAYDPANTWSTNRSYQDTQPSVTVANGETVLAYSSQDETKTVAEGRDIVVRNGTTERITGAGQFDDMPAIDASDGLTAVAFRRATTDDLANDTVPAVFNSTELALVTRTQSDSDWSAVTVLTDTNSEGVGAVETAVTGSDEILVAAEVGSAFESNNSDVRWLVLDSTGTELASGRITNASAPDLSGRTLSVFDSAAETVVTGTIAGGSFTVDAEHDASEYTDHAVEADQLVILENAGGEETVYGSETQPRFRQIDANGTETTVPIGTTAGNIDSVGQIDAAVVNDTLTVGYLAETGDGASVWRQQRTADGWTPARNVTASDAVVLRYLDVAGGQEFTAAYTASERGNDTVEDVYVTNRSASESFAVLGADSVQFGSDVRVTVTTQNVGTQEDTVEIALVENASGTETTLDSATATLAGGETNVTVFSSVPVPDDGQLRVALNTSTTAEQYTNETTLDVAVPRLSVGDAQLNRSSGQLAVDILNMGAVRADNLTVALEQGETTLANESVARVAVGETQTVTLTVPLEAIDPTAEQQIDIRGDLPPRAVTERPFRTRLVEPQVAVDPGTRDSVAYTNNSEGTVTATVPVRNYGEHSFEETLTARPLTNGTVANDTDPLAERTVTLDGGERATVELPLGAAVERGDSLQFAFPNVTTASAELGRHESTVDVLLQTARFDVGSLKLDRTDVRPGQNITVSTSLTHTGDLPGRRNVTLTLAGAESARQSVERTIGENGTVTFENVTADLDPGTYEVTVESRTDSATTTLSVTLPQFVNGPPQDIDGDGLHEDVRGDGEFNILDVQELFNNLNNSDMQDYFEYFLFFDREDPSEVTILDVQGLFNELDS